MDPSSLAELAHTLQQSADLYQNGHVQDERAAVLISLTATRNYLIRLGINKDHLEPIARPMDALSRLHDNSPDLLFTSGTSGGRPCTSYDQYNRMGVLAALANFWIDHLRSGMKKELALHKIAYAVRGRWSGNITSAELKSARRLVSREAKDHPAVQRAEEVMSALQSLEAEMGASAAFTLLLKRLNEAVASPGWGNWATQKNQSPSQL